MKFTNRQFGEVEYDEKHVIEFQEGIIGFEELKRYLIVNDEESEPFRWLVSLEDEDLSFAMIDPALIVSTYQSSLFKDLDVTVFLMVALKDPLEASTTNLRSPVVVENTSRQGRQLILDDESLSARHPLFSHQSVLVEG
ncbi:MAG: flagellar assembly protein FliW [Ignavibacteriales bacterium]|nr:flagellar assembly protein FliW [Ignavibacteriales bacterium]